MAFPWPAIVATVIAVFHWRSTHARPWFQRLSAGTGFVSLAAFTLLGAIWPSYYTVAALATLPAAVVLLVRLVDPSLMCGRWSRSYTRIALALPPVAFAVKFWWLTGGCEAMGKCV